MTDLFEQRLRAAARELPVPRAPDDLIGRVVAERARGERIILPTGAARATGRRGWVPAIAIAAASVAAIAVFATSNPTVRSLFDGSASSADSLASSGSFFVSRVYAAQTLTGPTFPPLAVAGAPALHAGTYRYRLQYVDSTGRVTPDGTGTVHISSVVTIPATEAWLVEHQSQSLVSGQQRVEAETLVVAKRDLRPITRVVTVRPYSHYSAIRITQRFTSDSVAGEMTTDGGARRTIAHRLPAAYAPYLSDALAPFALSGVRLSKNWSASLSIIGWAVVPSDVFYPVSLRVIADETLDMPMGKVDCWKVIVDAGQEHRIEWVRKTDGIGVRSYDERGTPSGHRVYDLLSFTLDAVRP